MTTCPECKRPTRYEHASAALLLDRVKASPNELVCYVVHEGYGCDTGCCGTAVYVETLEGRELGREFSFEHCDDGDEEGFCKEVTSELALRGVKLDLEQCSVSCY